MQVIQNAAATYVPTVRASQGFSVEPAYLFDAGWLQLLHHLHPPQSARQVVEATTGAF
jgi:hypothetical protein